MCPEVIKLGPVKPVLKREATIAAKAAKAAARGRGRGRGIPGRRPRGRPPKRAAAAADVVTPPPPTPGADAAEAAETPDITPETADAAFEGDAAAIKRQGTAEEEGVMEVTDTPAAGPPTVPGQPPSRRRARMTDTQSASPGPASKAQAVEDSHAATGAVLSQSGRPQRLGARRDGVWGNLSALANKGPATRYKPQSTRVGVVGGVVTR